MLAISVLLNKTSLKCLLCCLEKTLPSCAIYEHNAVGKARSTKHEFRQDRSMIFICEMTLVHNFTITERRFMVQLI